MSFVTEELAFQSDSLCREFLSQFGVVYADGERTKIDCKTSSAAVTSAWETLWTLYGQYSNYSVLKTFRPSNPFFKFQCTRFIFRSVGFALLVAYTFLPDFPNFTHIIPIFKILSSQCLLPVRVIEGVKMFKEESVALQIWFYKFYYLDILETGSKAVGNRFRRKMLQNTF